ncbi:hypothetical protein OESDEN_07957 [Oesophagostomum dentatum]|uniref:Uncharacterized protein n=1 Tax=Oesophagostomum dentatum TaxID=61180 RepID=A0A0B1T9Z9_OESDE|nr:hypothetical protein OESDEN_07957 [Oesophagostomum dentatum]
MSACTTEQPLDIAEAAKTIGVKISGFFKRGPAHLDYPVSEVYEGPLDSTNRISDIEGEPISHHVSVYHSGRSDEPAPKPEEEAKIDIADAAKTFGDKITGLFKRRPTIPDYPTSEPYEGPLEDTRKREDIESQPLQSIVTVYHSGRSDIPQEPVAPPAPTVAVVETVPAKDMYYDYPTTAVYEGPLDSTTRTSDIEGEPLTYHVSVYHSGRSDEPAPKPKPEEEQPLDIAEAAKTIGVKISGFFKRGPAHLDYPVSEEQPLDIAEAAKTIGVKISGFFKKGPAYLDYPVSEVYEGPLYSTSRLSDIQDEPLSRHVRVYHSGFSDSYYEAARRHPSPGTAYEDYSIIQSKDYSARDYGYSPLYDERKIKMVSSEEKQKLREESVAEPRREMTEDARAKVDLDIHSHQYFLSADNLERDQKPVGFSVSISARQPEDRTSSELFSSLSRESSSDKRYLRDISARSDRSQKHRLSPHTWTTVRERTEVTYVRKLHVERSLSPRSRSPPRSSYIKRVPYQPAVATTTDRSYTCRASNFDERVLVHHPIYPPHQSLYRNGTYGSGESRNGHAPTYSPVREVAAFDRTEWIEKHPSYIPPNRRADEIFTVGTPFIMGHVERDDNGCAYLRYQSSGLQERPPLTERLEDLPMIEEGAIECRRATIRANLRDMDTVGLVQDEEELERRRRPLRRARQRMRNYCTML